LAKFQKFQDSARKGAEAPQEESPLILLLSGIGGD
jgi:hypothetical protein